MSVWYYVLNQSPTGPITQEELLKILASGQISGATPVWKEGMPGWCPFAETELAIHLNAARSTVKEQAQVRSIAVVKEEIEINTNSNHSELFAEMPRVSGIVLPASFAKRSIAFLIDLVVMASFVGIIQIMLSDFNSTSGSKSGPEKQMISLVAGLLQVTFPIFYFVVLQAKLSGTLGKRMLGLCIVNQSLQKISISQSMLRFCGWMLGFSFFGIGIFWCARTAWSQCWHDLIAQTVVLEKSDYKALTSKQRKNDEQQTLKQAA